MKYSYEKKICHINVWRKIFDSIFLPPQICTKRVVGLVLHQIDKKAHIWGVGSSFTEPVDVVLVL